MKNKAQAGFEKSKRYAAKYQTTVTLAATYYGWRALGRRTGLAFAQTHIKIEPNGTATCYTWDREARAFVGHEVEGF